MKAEIKALVSAAKVTPGALGQSLGMAGLNIGKVVADINNVTKSYAGMKVPIVISYDIATKSYEIIVKLPSTSQLLMKEAGITKAAGTKEAPAGNISFDKVVAVAKKKSESLGADLKKAVLQVLGSCFSMGLNVDDADPKILQAEVKAGKHDDKLK
ncbi:MAG: 50S ribosomal protein L11 [Candidatus Nanoarchaeia archaeon]|jgi:large subunit ribosomal protein L11